MLRARDTRRAIQGPEGAFGRENVMSQFPWLKQNVDMALLR